MRLFVGSYHMCPSAFVFRPVFRDAPSWTVDSWRRCVEEWLKVLQGRLDALERPESERWEDPVL